VTERWDKARNLARNLLDGKYGSVSPASREYVQYAYAAGVFRTQGRDKAVPASAVPICNFTRRSPGVPVRRRAAFRVLPPPFFTAILAVRGRRPHGAGLMGKAETRPQVHHHIAMRRG